MKIRSLRINYLMRSAALLVGIVAISFALGNGVASADPELLLTTESVTVTQKGLSIEWSAGMIEWENSEDGVIPAFQGYETKHQPGAPLLPFHAIPFAIPADTKLEFNFDIAKTISIKPPEAIAIAPQPAGVLRDTQGNPIGGDFEPVSLVQNHLIKPIEIEELGTVAGVRLGRAVFSPIILQDEAYIFIPHASVEIRFTSTRAVPSLALPLLDGAMADILGQEVVNPVHLIPNQPSSLNRKYLQTAETGVAVIEFAAEGMAQVTYQQLTEFGIDPAMLDPTHLQILNDGSPLPIQWLGDDDAQFEPDEMFRFYAPFENNRWSKTSRFILKNDNNPRLAMGVRSGAGSEPAAGLKQRITLEENLIYSSDCLCGALDFGRDGDRWMWQELNWAGSQSALIDVPLANVNKDQPAIITVSMLGKTKLDTPLDHHVSVKLNGATLGSLRWDGQTAHTQSLSIPAGLIQDVNQVEIALVEAGFEFHSVWLDAIEFDYATISSTPLSQEKVYGQQQPSSYTQLIDPTHAIAIYDVSEPTTPLFLTNPSSSDTAISWADEGRSNSEYIFVPADAYLTPNSITPSNGLYLNAESDIDIIMIAPNQFIESGALQPLVSLRQTQGWRVGVESVEEIYLAFGAGVPQPTAIRDYLKWGYHNWDTRPQMVLLVGDGSTDPKQHLTTSSATRIPPFLDTVDAWMGETAVDNRFVTVDGEDTLPDMMMGRLPVNTTIELEQTVEKIVRYETAETVGAWNRKSIWVADNGNNSRLFEGLSEELLSYFVQSPFFAQRFYLTPNKDNLANIQQNAVQSWQNGAGLIVYTGHASRHQWAAERLFHFDDVASLSNQEKLPFVMHLSCLTGSFHSSSLTALDERLMRQPAGGAIGVWGSSGLGVATGHHLLAAGALDLIYSHDAPTLGSATLSGKVRLATRGAEHAMMLDTFNLLGDPASRLNLNLIDLSAHSVHLPIVQH